MMHRSLTPRLLRTACLIALLAGAAPFVRAAAPIARLEKKDGRFTFLVDGKPYLILGGQVLNNHAYPDLMEPAWARLKAMHVNTVEYPVYWNAIEPQEGQFDFGDFDRLLFRAHGEGLHVVLLWFGTYKNGAMDWVPNWVKTDPTRFPRVIDSGGHPTRTLSPHGEATLKADRTAYEAMMKHLKEVDHDDRTVIMVQVENEPGLLGSVRDFSAASDKLFAGPVPEALVTALKKPPGTWREVFGADADETFAAYYVARYVNAVARAGKQIYPLVTYVNAWNGGDGTNDQFNRFDWPGETYPSGGPVSRMIDVWKAAAPDIDILASDTSKQPSANFRMIASRYVRPDNPYWSPEAGLGPTGARVFFYALTDYSAIGFGAFGVDRGPPGAGLDARFAGLADDYRLVQTAIPVLIPLQGTPKLQAAVEEYGISGRNLNFDRYALLVRFRPRAADAGPKRRSPVPSSRVLVAQLKPDEFLVLGFDATVDFRPALGSGDTAAQFLQVEQGEFSDGHWQETARGRVDQGSYDPPRVILPPRGAIYRVKLMRY